MTGFFLHASSSPLSAEEPVGQEKNSVAWQPDLLSGSHVCKGKNAGTFVPWRDEEQYRLAGLGTALQAEGGLRVHPGASHAAPHS